MGITHEEWRKHQWYSVDPLYGEIQPALLNSVDIRKYVDSGCLVEGEDFEDGQLKTASYEMKFLGEVYDWIGTMDGKLRRRRRVIEDGCSIELPRNSISYLWIKEKLLLPEYIAARFNLHIRHVHKGLLLGTGPLVDPGFFGRLLVPLHNLTDNDYLIEGGDGIIWVEFTKVSENKFWRTDGVKRPGNLKEFPNRKDLGSPIEYIEKARVTEAGGVQSAFKGALDQARTDADGAHNELKKIKRLGIVAIAIGFFAILGSVAALWLSGHSLIARTVSVAQESQNAVVRAKLDGLAGRMERLEGGPESSKVQTQDDAGGVGKETGSESAVQEGK